MIPYKLDFTINELNSDRLAAQGILQAYTGKVMPKSEAVRILQRIPDHKWYLSERLGRDVGMRVAAVDFIENFYEPSGKRSSSFLTGAKMRLESLLRAYLTAKSGLTPL
ncbi:MAG TPA: DUF4032 domain-containing protein [Pyrinomonadaceae bacterium]|jgi:hypothetical protein|nr:DUF4032 domain-containing protein [Pyrinomonadaceae bacterium]